MGYWEEKIILFTHNLSKIKVQKVISLRKNYWSSSTHWPLQYSYSLHNLMKHSSGMEYAFFYDVRDINEERWNETLRKNPVDLYETFKYCLSRPIVFKPGKLSVKWPVGSGCSYKLFIF